MTSRRLTTLGLAIVFAVVTPKDANAKGAGGGGRGGHSGGTSGKVSSSGPVKVSGYTKANGTYVAPHWRSAPDGTPWNNWSTKGNVNPFTGKLGTHWPSVSGNAGIHTNGVNSSEHSPSEAPSQSWQAPIPRPLTFTEQKWRDQEKLFRRIVTAPLDAEITSGKAHNVILEILGPLANESPAITGDELDPTLLKCINVSVGASGHQVGIFKDGAYIDWPIALRGPTQRGLSAALAEAVHAAASGSFELSHYSDLKRRLGKLEDELRTKFHKEEIDATLFLAGKRFLESLDSAVRSLQDPAAQQMLGGAYEVSGSSVGTLLSHMSTRGLKFAPAVPGREAAYFELYRAFVRYAKVTAEARGSAAASKTSSASTLVAVSPERKGNVNSDVRADVASERKTIVEDYSEDRSPGNPANQGSSTSQVSSEAKAAGVTVQNSASSTIIIEPKSPLSAVTTPSAPQPLVVTAPSVTVINNNGEQGGFPWFIVLLIFALTTPLQVLAVCVLFRIAVE